MHTDVWGYGFRGISVYVVFVSPYFSGTSREGSMFRPVGSRVGLQVLAEGLAGCVRLSV